MKHWKVSSPWILFLLVTSISSLLAGCGGGGGGGDGVSTSAVNGVAAVGAPLSGTVSLKDSSSPPRVKTAAIDGQGNYAIDVTGLAAPFIIEATGTAAGTNHTLCSFTTGPGRANVNPLTNLIVADAAGVDDPDSVYQNPTPPLMQQIGGNLPAAISRMQSMMHDLLVLYNSEDVNPCSGPYVADGTGLDALFDQVRIVLSGGNVTMTNIATNGVILHDSMTGMHNWRMNSAHYPMMTTVPAPPASVSATGGTGEITVSWSRVSGATSYNIYWSSTAGVTTSTGTRISGAAAPYVHSGLTAGTSYYYVVTAVNGAGESAASSEASATTGVPAQTCGTCHAIPPATGKHGLHVRIFNCATCHGSGYSSTTANSATHMNGAADLLPSVGWNAGSGSCSNSCHGNRSW